MKTLIAVAFLVGGLLKRKFSVPIQKGKGPYADIDAEDGNSWFMYKRAGKRYEY